jgi:peptidoglycan-associated lipoprotein
MNTTIKRLALGILGGSVLSACATQGNLTKLGNKHDADMVATQAALDATAQRAAADNAATNRDVSSVKGDVGTLRSDLGQLRTQYGAKITELQDQIAFALPITFDFNDPSIRSDNNQALDRFATVAQKYYGGSQIRVEGYADPAGTRRYNRVLSQKRADNVKAYLVSKGFDDTQVRAVGMGAERPAVPGARKDDAGADQNRRVEFVISTKGAPAAVASTGTAGTP